MVPVVSPGLALCERPPAHGQTVFGNGLVVTFGRKIFVPVRVPRQKSIVGVRVQGVAVNLAAIDSAHTVIR